MTKKVGVTLPDGIFDILESRAESYGQTPTGLAAFLLQYCIVNNVGFIDAPELKETISIQFLQSLAFGNIPPDEELIKLSARLSIPYEVLARLRDACKERSPQ
ncbi:hypothetical protein [Limnoraphis robusta]|uniref:Uncharacterized protein n=1 Tax=Limnoraphis robusta CS-951 TaxID=1637645 RepID=A0A0F5YHW3_9CYAN|nr:hypothetical protein [Limnoraphis robusta]KKD38494.1 hypothetical protein WN50_08550 [Limnoraphis robusta CS-951]